jgi:hypothetical protein
MDVLRVGDVEAGELGQLLSRYQLRWKRVDADAPIPGSYWGGAEAGLVGRRLFAREDTPVHSVLHETAHFVCMSPERREHLERDAGGDDDEENAVCYLQVILSDHLSGVSRERLFRDMDAWGYSFRLGSSRRWFHEDAAEAFAWLHERALIDDASRPMWRVNGRGR